jgi:homoserine dehydrogenase
LEICGILNGTTNYILTQMENSSTAFSDALTEAQRQGYAEADPSSDIKGTDACRKIAILSSLAFGRHVDPNIIPTRGISDISQEVTQKALSLGGVVRLLARSRVEPGGDIAVHVEPYFVPSGHPFHSVRDVFNAIVIVGDATGPVLFSGRGAGRMPTASAVMGDIYFCANHLHDNQFPSWESSPAPFLTLNPFESEETVSLGDLTLHIVPNFFFGGSGC